MPIISPEEKARILESRHLPVTYVGYIIHYSEPGEHGGRIEHETEELTLKEWERKSQELVVEGYEIEWTQAVT